MELGNDRLSNQTLIKAFRTFAEKRQLRTAALVKGARTQGQRRIVTGGPIELQSRDEAIRNGWRDLEAVEQRYDELCREPF